MNLIANENIICTHNKRLIANNQFNNKDYDTQDNKEECTRRYTFQRVFQSRSHKNMKQTKQKERDPQNRHLSILFRGLLRLLLIVLLRVRHSLSLQTLNEMSILPSELAGQMTNSDVGTVRSIPHSICFELYLR